MDRMVAHQALLSSSASISFLIIENTIQHKSNRHHIATTDKK